MTVSSFSVDVSSVELKVIVLEVSPEAKLIVCLLYTSDAADE